MDNGNAAQKAQELTQVSRFKSGDRFSLSASDLLEYAKIALKGGDASINEALMKASNKIASVINKKCEKLLMFEKLDTPFPEVK
jgi:hypothetical protein